MESFQSLIEDGRASYTGDLSILTKLAERMVDFDPYFEIMPGTKAPNDSGSEAPNKNDYEHEITMPAGE